MNEVKLCVNCKYYRVTSLDSKLCTRKDVYSVVDNSVLEHTKCIRERYPTHKDADVCGFSGKYWEPQDI